MSDIQRDRLKNFRRLVADRGLTPQSLSDRLGSRYSYWRDLLAGEKSFGEKAARRIEEGLEIPRGWLDQYMSKFNLPEEVALQENMSPLEAFAHEVIMGAYRPSELPEKAALALKRQANWKAKGEA
jgi:hypothetical protein